ncbi:hypothetical protein L228DRAFT_244851 [Xylona heveae TC161]|uniref:Uncharacterized protein n=1 Tax=Xylona heveae (strain CBS 132557 / TC161) TaxID=1328760 RepID=A0A165HVU4_XYLHT|nr:hypothetical protein L228DRAFT_244851 [Xylona heveae TC161]KZF23991.1 hypothetical protein L228DRAFT_244851 [Xylona heveae TC161]
MNEEGASSDEDISKFDPSNILYQRLIHLEFPAPYLLLAHGFVDDAEYHCRAFRLCHWRNEGQC